MFDIYLTNNSVLRSRSIMMRLEPAGSRVVTPLCNQCLFETSLCNCCYSQLITTVGYACHTPVTTFSHPFQPTSQTATGCSGVYVSLNEINNN